MPRLNSVRAKLTFLVALSAIAALVALPILSWSMHKQLIDEVDDRVPEAVRGFELELDDDLRDLRATARQLALEPEVTIAMRGHGDPKALAAQAETFHDAYPDIDVAFFGDDGALVGSVGVSQPPARLSELGSLNASPDSNERSGVLAHGCERNSTAAPAYAIARSSGTGWVMACLPLDAAYLHNAATKLGVELGMLDPGVRDDARVSTERLPRAEIKGVGKEPSLATDPTGKMWALVGFEPEVLVGEKGHYGVVTALDVSDIRDIVRRNMVVAGGVLVLAALLALIMGARVAAIMSDALNRMNLALRKLQLQEYVHVQGVATGDELEDLAVGFNTMVDGMKERDKLRSTFGKYMTQTVMEHLLSGKVQLGGETLTVSILFSDIRSFTSISERMDAQELVGLLNEYFTEMVTIIMEEDGVVDKYIGDAIMAVFGAPVSKPDDAVRAVRAGVRMRTALYNLNDRLRERGLAPLQTGIGIHTGEVVAGNIGSESRMEYTVIGDAVNLASRLESNTKELGVHVLISEDTYRLVESICVARPVREITVKGRAQPVMTYEVQGLSGSESHGDVTQAR